jgi:antiviral helicase SKI2
MTFVWSPFQKEAIRGIEDGHHVFITAHTGSGKTLPAEYAIDFFTKKGKKVIYTSPIKSLSNQKYSDFLKKYPSLKIGLLTGDNKHNTDADVLIMTTEILCNKLSHYNTETKPHLDFDMNDLGCVIFDEAHYINDEDRGTIWEESMMLLPPDVQMVMLSATIGNVRYISEWLEATKGKHVVVCGTTQRVVPLDYYQYFTVHEKGIQSLTHKPDRDLLYKNYNRLHPIDDTSLKQTKKALSILKPIRVNRKYVINQVCGILREKEMFPALFFVFSRKKVEELARELTTPLFDPSEKDCAVEPICRQLLVSRVTNWKEYILLPEYVQYVNLLEKGIGVHHAGMLPIFREMIEILYEQKYIKVLFATETFAVGLNMPTKTVCFTSVHKHDGSNFRRLHNYEFKQMCGRAGRRNIDTIGYVILLTNLFQPMDPSDYKELLAAKETNVKSKFKMNYSFVLKHSSRFSKEQCCAYIQKSLMYRDIQKKVSASNDILNTLESQRQKHPTYDLCHTYHEWSLHKKKYKKEMNTYEIEHNILKELPQYYKLKELETAIGEEMRYKEFSERFIECQIDQLYALLTKEGFLKDDRLTLKGDMACLINEFHRLVFIDVYNFTSGFKSYTSAELFALLSCFCDLKSDVYMPKDDLLTYIHTRLTYYEDLESTLYGNTAYRLNYCMYEPIKQWLACDDEASCLQCLQAFIATTDLSIGDFVKGCLKIIHMSQELGSVCEFTKDYVCLEKIKQGKQSLLKFIMNNQSLYV